jgi:Flp pilus assembly protein TadB
MVRTGKTTQIADDDLVIVARVAEREGWEDLEKPPAEHSGSPRTLDETAAVLRFVAHLAATDPAAKRRSALRLRLAVAAGAIVVLGVCWWVSPTRTAIALIGGGLFCLIALKRGRKERRFRRPAFIR